MRTSSTNLFLAILGVLLSFSVLSAQENAPVEVTGTVFEQASQQPIEFATVMLQDKATKAALTGATTNADGSFRLQTKVSDFTVKVSFVGYTEQEIVDFELVDGKVDLGRIYLTTEGKTLDEVLVRAERSQTEFKLDKRVFNVGKDLSSTGASALEVLNNVPSVNVSIEGEVSLRGSAGVQILINGKPSVLASEQGNALGTLTAEMIESIEVITNPSAKYEAEGTSGIINIILKKEERRGMNGSVTVNTGVPHNHSLGLSLNRRTEKFNLFSQLGVGYRELPRDRENINRDLVTGTELRSEGREFRNEQFYNLILGTDYHINDLNVLTLSGNFAYEIEDQPSRTDFRFFDEAGFLANEWFRKEVTKATNPKWNYELQYKKEFKDDEDHTLLFSAMGNFFGKDLSSEFANTSLLDGSNFGDQRTRTNFQEAEYTFKLDYTKPFTEELTLETGAMYVANDVSNDFAVSDLNDGIWVLDSSLTNIFEYNQDVLGVYGTAAYEADKWGLKLGLRVENTDLKTFLVNTEASNDQNFTNFFPTAHASYKLTERVSLQAGYSRRIFRPRLWDLNPFFNIRNNFSIRTGNPNLLPEFTDSYEVSSIYILGKASMNFSVYYRYTTDVVERVSTFENNVNITMPMNIGTNRTTGLEFNFKYSPKRWLTFNGDANYNYFNRQGELEGTSFDFTADQWSGKLTAKFKLPADIDFEMTGQYLSGVQTVQSLVSENYFLDLGLRKKVMGGRGVFNFSVRDVFASRIRESVVQQPSFYLYNFAQRGRFITLGFSYGFGKGEAMEFSGQKRF
jgi:outer membrane receptor protein involved in Fe transport